MKKIDRKYVFAGLVACGVVFYSVSLYVHTQQAEYVAQMKILIAQQETTIISLAEVTDRNGADAAVTAIIRDCPVEDRQKFDELLGNLGTLSNTELAEVNQLFDMCGHFYAETKALMTARLHREFEVYSDYVALLDIVDARTESIVYPVAQWNELVTFESQRSELSAQLVTIQKEIILALIEGSSIHSEQMRQEVAKAQEVNDTLSYIGVKIDALREGIIGL